MPEVVVVGSLNMDLVVKVAALPAPGETVRGEPFQTFPGGKGANQAVAAALLGAEVAMVGRVGDDPFGAGLKETLSSAGVDLSLVESAADQATGMAMITVDSAGQNTIVLSAGANGGYLPRDLNRLEELISRAKVLLLQLEIPLESVLKVVDLAAPHPCRIILNPAPYRDLSPDLLRRIDCLVPNEVEAGGLTGIEVSDLPAAEAAAERLLALGLPRVIITLGRKGALWAEGASRVHLPAFPVQAVDATAAGDAFIGCLAVALVRSKSYLEATLLASAAGALTATRLGAQASLPDREALNRFLKDRGQPPDLCL